MLNCKAGIIAGLMGGKWDKEIGKGAVYIL